MNVPEEHADMVFGMGAGLVLGGLILLFFIVFGLVIGMRSGFYGF